MKYITTYFASFFFLLFSIASFNWFIDPFGMFWSPQLENFNQLKPEAGSRSRITKAYQANNINPEVLIVGNSRVEMGLNPLSTYFSNTTVYNQGIPGAGLRMQIDYALNTIASSSNVQHIIIGLDFVDFLIDSSDKQFKTTKEKTPNYAFRLPQIYTTQEYSSLSKYKELLGLTFSLDAFSSSILTITKQNSLSSSIDPLGFNNAFSYKQIMESEGIRPLFTQKLEEVKSRLLKKRWTINTTNSYPYSKRYLELGRLIEKTVQKNIKLTIFINPYHYSYLHTIAENKYWNSFELWKETLLNYLTTKQKTEVKLWDFSVINEVINEDVPLSTPKKAMNWFWEPAHYKKELGEEMLSILLNKELQAHSSSTFGTQITINNIDNILLDNRKDLAKSEREWLMLKKELRI